MKRTVSIVMILLASFMILATQHCAALVLMIAGALYTVADTIIHSHVHKHHHFLTHTHDGSTHTHAK